MYKNRMGSSENPKDTLLHPHFKSIVLKKVFKILVRRHIEVFGVNVY